MLPPSRRAFLIGAGAATLAAGIRPAHALVQERFQTLMRQVMGLMWVGQARSYNDQFEGGELVTAIGMKFELRADWSYEGAMVEALNYNGNVYKAFHRIEGECWTIGDEAGVSIYRSELIEASALPSNFAWSTVRGDFRFYNDSNRKGHFTLQGILTNTDGGQSRVIMNDSDE